MNTINVNGKSYNIPNGASVSIDNNVIRVNGKVLSDYGTSIERNIVITVNGNINSLDCGGSVVVNGDVGDADVAGSLECHDIKGNVDCAGSIRCNKIMEFHT